MHGMSAHEVPAEAASHDCLDHCCDLSAADPAGSDAATALTPSPFPLAAGEPRPFVPGGPGPACERRPEHRSDNSLAYLQTLRLRL